MEAKMMRKISDEEIGEAVAEVDSISALLKKIGSIGTTYAERKEYLLLAIRRLELDTTHWLGRYRPKRTPSKPRTPLKQILKRNSTYKNRQQLRRRVIDEKILEEVCVLCSTGPNWNGMHLTLQLDHINGISNDNRKENLRFLCPNCHTQTETWGVKNISSKLPNDRELAILALTNTYTAIAKKYGVHSSTVSRRMGKIKKNENNCD
jgi:5-methylcytosine-specific restriction endonuclease McrA